MLSQVMRLTRPGLAALLTAVLVAGSGLPAAAADHDEAAYQQVVDITFPTAAASARTPIRGIDGTSYGFMNDYEHARSNTCGIHRATDIFGPHDQPVYAAVAGKITYMPDPAPSWGWMVRIVGDDGRQYNYIHLGRDDGPREEAYADGLDVGDRVARGELIGYLGSSGNASEELPHLHFEIRDDDVADSNQWDCPYINPYYSLKAAVDRDDLAPDDPPDAGESNPEGGGLPEATVDRISGPDRVATAIELTRTAHDRAGTVVLAPARSFPEAAVAGPLAAALDAAVVLTWPHALDSRAAAEITRLEAEEVVLVGGLEELGDRVVAELVSKAGIAPDGIRRIAGRDAFATAAAVAEEVWAAGGRTRQAVIALGDHPDPDRAWPDALASSWYGVVTGAPVLLVDHERLPQATADALDGVDEAVIAGGSAAVSEDVADGIADRAGEVRRLFGQDRYATAVALAADLVDDDLASLDRVWVATGTNWADAAAAARAIAHHGDAFVLVDGDGGVADASVNGWWDDQRGRIGAGRAIGGTAAVSDAALDRLLDRIS